MFKANPVYTEEGVALMPQYAWLAEKEMPSLSKAPPSTSVGLSQQPAVASVVLGLLTVWQQKAAGLPGPY